MENDIPDAARVSVELANDAGNYGEMIDINRLHNGALQLRVLQRVEHLHLLHYAVKHICTAGLPVLHGFKNVNERGAPAG